MTNQQELGLLIERGLEDKNVMEAVECFLQDIHGKFYVCALGLALVGKYKSSMTAFETVEKAVERSIEVNGRNFAVSPNYLYIATILLDIDYDLAESIDKAHMLGASADQISYNLEQGSFIY